MKNLLRNVLTLVTIVSVIIGILASLGWIQQRGERQRSEQNLYNKTVQWKDERGRLVTETTELRFTNKELRKVAKKDSTALSDVETKLLRAHQTIDALRIKPSRVETISMIDIKTESEEVTGITVEEIPTAQPVSEYQVDIKPIRTKHLELVFKQIGDSLHVSHLYRTAIDVVVDRDKGLNKQDGKRFFLIRWIRPEWKYSSNVVAEDPNAEITSNVYINFQRRKGKRK